MLTDSLRERASFFNLTDVSTNAHHSPPPKWPMLCRVGR